MSFADKDVPFLSKSSKQIRVFETERNDAECRNGPKFFIQGIPCKNDSDFLPRLLATTSVLFFKVFKETPSSINSRSTVCSKIAIFSASRELMPKSETYAYLSRARLLLFLALFIILFHV
jgi:hypothetical protein